MRPSYRWLLPVLFGALTLACGGGSSKHADPAPSFSVGMAALTLPVPPLANVDVASKSYPSPYAGTVTLTVTRNAGFTSPVTLSLDASKLPTGVKATFVNPTIPSGSTTAVLSVQAGYPDPSDTTFTKQIYPALGTYAIPITATASGSSSQAVSLSLKLIEEPADFGLAFCSADGAALNDFTALALLGGATLSEPFQAYWAVGTYGSPWGPVALSTLGVPAGLSVNLDTHAATLNDVHTMTISAQSGLKAGTYSFELIGTYLGVTHSLPVVVTYSPAPFSIQSPLSSTVTLLQGQILTFPMYLWHNDAYFGTTTPTDGTDPLYVGATNLTVSGVPAGLTVGFANANPTGLASTPLQISAGPSLAPGTYLVNLQATRTGGATVPAAPFPLTVNVTSAGAAPTLWLQNCEWGQSVVTPNLRLVGGKPALLRVQLMADRPSVAAPPVTATVKNQGGSTLDTLTLQGPATVPMNVAEGDLPSALSPSASSYTILLPAADIQPGMTVTIQAGTLSQTLTPSVDPGYTLNLTVVPIYCQGVAPVLPADSAMTQELLAFWPLRGVNLVRRTPYTTSTVIPQPSADPVTDTSGDGWFQLLEEMASLRIIDGSAANYYGFFNPGLKPGFTSSLAGISLQGEGAGIGVDVATARQFANDDPALDLASTVMVHEEGHAFNVNHAPAGGAGSPQLNYPYAGASTGSWGFDPATFKAYDPVSHFDLMSYAPNPHWVSDWDYLSAMGFLGQKKTPPVSLGFVAAPVAETEQWVVSGMVRPDGQVRLSPLVRVACAALPPKSGELKLLLTSESGTRSVSFTATQVPDLPSGYRHFAFTVPASDELTSVEIPSQRVRSYRSMRQRNLASRAMAVEASVQDGTLVVQESAEVLHLEWDAQVHPYVTVLHEGSTRTVLGLHLTGGSVDVPLAGLPAGGQFVIHYSDGLNAVVRHADRIVRP